MRPTAVGLAGSLSALSVAVGRVTLLFCYLEIRPGHLPWRSFPGLPWPCTGKAGAAFGPGWRAVRPWPWWAPDVPRCMGEPWLAVSERCSPGRVGPW